MRDHLLIVELLPDYVLGKLDDASLRRVTRHLENCQTCQREYANAMDVLGQLAQESPPGPWLRGTILRRAAAMQPATGTLNANRTSPLNLPAVAERAPLRLLPEWERRPGMPFGHPVPRWLLLASSAAVMLFSGLMGWSYQQQTVVTSEDRIQALVADPAAAFPLDDSDVGVPAAGVLFAEPDGREVYLVANGLPVLPHDQRYQVWLFTTEDELVSAGMVSVSGDGAVRELLQTPAPFADYVGVGLTVEPQTGSDSPTSDLVLGGSFPPPELAPAGVPPLPNVAVVNA